MKEIIELLKQKLELFDVSIDTNKKYQSKQYDGRYIVLEEAPELSHTYIAMYCSIDSLEENPLIYINCANPQAIELEELESFIRYALNNSSDTEVEIEKIKNILKGE